MHKLKNHIINDIYSYKKENLLRKGKFSLVYLGKNIKTNQQILIKQLHLSYINDENFKIRFKNEAKFNFNNKHIINYIDIIEDIDGNIYLIREYINGVDLKGLLSERKFRKKLNQSFVAKCAIQILNALESIHNQNYIHCDIKPSNIILRFNNNAEPDWQNPEIVLIDFGLLRKNEQFQLLNDNYFSLIYSPPEQMLKAYSLIQPASDLFSLGVSIYELITLKKPFYHTNPEMLMNLQLNYQLKPHKRIQPDFYDIIKKATAKFQFKKPPRFYSNHQLYYMIKSGVEKRYQSVVEMKNDINKLSLNIH